MGLAPACSQAAVSGSRTLNAIDEKRWHLSYLAFYPQSAVEVTGVDSTDVVTTRQIRRPCHAFAMVVRREARAECALSSRVRYS